VDDSVSTQRRIDLDWLRIGAFGLLILYHIGMYYVTWDWHVKSPHASATIEPLLLLVNPWRLGLLFVVSGAATAFMLGKMSAGRLAGLRSWRLLVPLLFGMLVIVPPQSYFEVVQKAGYGGSYGEFWLRYLQGDHGFCDKDGCLTVPTWNHLWFVAYLWVYTMLLAAAAAVWRDRPARWMAPIQRALAGPGILVWPWLWLAVARFGLADRFPATHALVDDWYNHAVYLPLFLFGFAVARSEVVWSAIVRWRWPALALAVASSAAVTTYLALFAGGDPPAGLRVLMRALYTLDQWSSILALLGWAHVAIHRDSPARRYLTDAIFPFYIVHQTAIIAFSQWLKPFALPVAAEAPILVALTALTCLLCYEIVRRVRVLRPLFGLKIAGPRPRRTQSA
jgi:glucan biosynthesis protein C